MEKGNLIVEFIYAETGFILDELSIKKDSPFLLSRLWEKLEQVSGEYGIKPEDIYWLEFSKERE
jgi:hypothetical protein